jgi:hypothetical protein
MNLNKIIFIAIMLAIACNQTKQINCSYKTIILPHNSQNSYYNISLCIDSSFKENMSVEWDLRYAKKYERNTEFFEIQIPTHNNEIADSLLIVNGKKISKIFLKNSVIEQQYFTKSGNLKGLITVFSDDTIVSRFFEGYESEIKLPIRIVYESKKYLASDFNIESLIKTFKFKITRLRRM